MKAYLVTTGTAFSLLVVAHVWRLIVEPGIAGDAWWWLITAVGAGLSVWAWWLLLRRLGPR